MSSLTTNVELLLLTYSFVMGMVTKVKAPISKKIWLAIIFKTKLTF